MAGAFGCVPLLADPRRAAIDALLATHGSGDGGPITVTGDPGLRFRAVDAFADLAEELALAGPLVVGVDDLQWADPSSLLTLAALSRRLAYLPVGLIGCLRPSPRIPELDHAGLLLDAGGRHLTLRGLTEQAVTELVAVGEMYSKRNRRIPGVNRWEGVGLGGRAPPVDHETLRLCCDFVVA